jgi:hypothetical protein
MAADEEMRDESTPDGSMRDGSRRGETVVALPTYNESEIRTPAVRRDDARFERIRSTISEGAHGELRYDGDDASA